MNDSKNSLEKNVLYGLNTNTKSFEFIEEESTGTF